MEDLKKWKTNFPEDIRSMHDKFGVKNWVKNAEHEQKRELMKLRMRMLTEEYAETMNAYLEGDAEEVIDGLVDLIVIALGTLDITGVDGQAAWNSVYNANISKSVGRKPGRPNPLGLPDLIKPDGWVAPDHSDYHGNMKDFL